MCNFNEDVFGFDVLIEFEEAFINLVTQIFSCV